MGRIKICIIYLNNVYVHTYLFPQNRITWAFELINFRIQVSQIFNNTEFSKYELHTNITGHYNPSVRIIDLVSRTTYVMCVNFIHKWRDLQFKVDSEWHIFWETFHGNFIHSQSFCRKSAERKSPKKYFSYFVLMSGLGLELWLFPLLSQHTIY